MGFQPTNCFEGNSSVLMVISNACMDLGTITFYWTEIIPKASGAVCWKQLVQSSREIVGFFIFICLFIRVNMSNSIYVTKKNLVKKAVILSQEKS